MKDLLTLANLRREHVKVSLTETLIKDLESNERICEHCNGSGLHLKEIPFSTTEITENTSIPESHSIRPFVHQFIGRCVYCNHGIRKWCDNCENYILPNHLMCDCQYERLAQEKALKRKIAYKKASKISLDDAFEQFDFIYEESTDTFIPTDDLPLWLQEIALESVSISFVDLYESFSFYGTTKRELSIDASFIVGDALEDLHEDAEVTDKAITELQKYLDKWCAANGELSLTYEMDYNAPINVPETYVLAQLEKH